MPTSVTTSKWRNFYDKWLHISSEMLRIKVLMFQLFFLFGTQHEVWVLILQMWGGVVVWNPPCCVRDFGGSHSRNKISPQVRTSISGMWCGRIKCTSIQAISFSFSVTLCLMSLQLHVTMFYRIGNIAICYYACSVCYSLNFLLCLVQICC